MLLLKIHTYYLTASFPGKPGQTSTRKKEPFVIVKQEMAGWQ